jgi:hypothetical protein
MKKILLTFIAAILFYGAYAQTGINLVTYTCHFIKDSDKKNCGNTPHVNFNIYLSDGTVKKIIELNADQIRCQKDMYIHTENLFELPPGITVTKVEFDAFIFERILNGLPNDKCIDCNGQEFKVYKTSNINTVCMNTIEVPFQAGKVSGYYKFRIRPVIQSIKSSSNILPNTDKITLTAIKGFPSYVYRWQYRIGNGIFIDLPAYDGLNEIKVSGYDIMGNAFDNLYGDNNNIHFRIKSCGTIISPPVTLTPQPSAPHILSVTPVPNTCFGEANGYMKIQFDRALKLNETLTIEIADENNNPDNEQKITNLESLPADNTVISSPMLKASKFIIKLIGKYNGLNTYAGGINHTAKASFVSPLPLSFSANKTNDVYCFAGSDGTITINAAGGTGNYMAGYKKQWQNNYTWVNFGEAKKHVLNNLDTGSYQIRVKDANGCVELNQGSEVVRTVIIAQPEMPLKKEFVQIINPLQFGSTDGNIKVILKGGTPKPDQSYNIGWTDINNNILNNYINNIVPTGYQTLLHNIGANKYILTATDNNYIKAANNSKQGCLLKDTFQLVQPLLITVSIDEQDYISCKNFNDGQLVAHASGGIKFQQGLPYHYQWFKIINNVNVDINQPDSIATELSAGKYFVKITDFNNITKASAIYNLTEPEQLKVEFTSTPVSCSGGNDGSAKAIVSGGTEPYQYEWTTTETTPLISNLPEGIYLAFIKDAHQCETQGQIKVVTPNPIKVNPAIKNPNCYQSCDGFIKLGVLGGVAPYTYQWSNGAITKDINNVCAGNYSVTITDAKNCTRVENFSLINPLPVLLNLAKEKTLCLGQNYEANATINDPAAQYQWGSDKGFAANTAKVLLSNEGIYWVKVTNSNNCVGNDTIIIHRKNADIAAEFIATTQAFKGELVRFINLSLPSPDSISWIIPNDPNIQVITNTQNITELKFADTGVYYISLKSYKGGCEKIFTKKIIVLEPQPFNNPGQVQDPFIKEFTIAPNPNNGQFTVKVTLKEQSKIRLRMYNVLSNALVSDRQESGSSQYTLPYNLNVVAGTYFLLLETAKGNIMYKIIIN